MAAITCHYVTLPDNGAQLHYRMAGEGPPLIMLHPSPQNSQALEPAMAAFSQLCSCVAIDTPGYGLSDDPTADDASLRDYGDIVFAAADALGLERFCLYGAATGAQIAIEMGKHRPERLALVLLDANGHIDADERARVMQGYFAPVTPRRDGGHFLTLWDMCSRLFTSFPWNSDRPEDRLPIPRLPAAIVHATLLRYLDAGEDYAKAYRTAFEAEDIAHFGGFAAPAVMTRWEGSAVLRIGDDLIAQGLPENVRVLRAGPPIAERYAVQADALRNAIGESGLADFQPVEPQAGRVLHRSYLATPSGQLHGWRSDAGEGTRIVMLHGAGASAQRWRDWWSALQGQRPFLALDLPGHGHTRVAADFASVESLVEPVMAALAPFGTQRIHLVGEGLGGAVALGVQGALPDARVTLIDPLAWPDDAPNDALADALPDLTPVDSGAHLLAAWHHMRERALRWPWWDGSVAAQRVRPLEQSPDALHDRTADALRLGESYAAALALEVSIDWREMAASMAGDCTIALTPAHPCPDRIEALIGSAVPSRRIDSAADLFG